MAPTLLHLPVCAAEKGRYIYGQVVAVSGTSVQVRTVDGEVTVPSAKVEEVAPVVCLLLQDAALRTRGMSRKKLGEHHATIVDRLLGVNGSNGTRNVEELLRDIVPRAQIPNPAATREWTDPDSGGRVAFSLRHAIDYGYFVDGDRPIPVEMRASIGESFWDEPPNPPAESVVAPAPTHRGTIDRPVPAPPTRSVALDTLLDALEEDEAAVAPTTASAQTELVQLLSSKPHLLALYLDQCLPNTRKRAALDHADAERATQRPRTSALEPVTSTALDRFHLNDALERGQSKESFRPSPIQRAVHAGITARKYQGTIPSTYIALNFSSTATEFKPDLAVLHRLFDFQFGKRGLSIAYFALFDDDVSGDGCPMSTSAKPDLPPRPIISRLQDLRDNLAVLETFTLEFFDDLTCDLIRAAVVFSKRITSLIAWQPQDIPRLVKWFDSVLEDYRQAVEELATSGTDRRDHVRRRFNIADPTFVVQLLNIQSRRGVREQHARETPRSDSNSSREVDQKKRKVPNEVLAALPKQNGRSICMRYLSVRGCPSRQPDRCIVRNLVHADVKVTNPVARKFIDEYYGGVRDDLA